jgi:toxin ParE1/3/4
MAHRLALQVEVELDEIWYYIARDSGNMEIADRLIDAITDRFFPLGNHPYVGRLRDHLRSGLRSFHVANMSSSSRINGIDVLILHAMHGRREIEAMFGR